MSRPFMLAATAALWLADAAFAQSLSLKDMPDEVRATIRKELARKFAGKPAAGAASDDAIPPHRAGSGNDCSMSIGSPERPGPGTRKVVVVATKPIVQFCK